MGAVFEATQDNGVGTVCLDAALALVGSVRAEHGAGRRASAEGETADIQFIK